MRGGRSVDRSRVTPVVLNILPDGGTGMNDARNALTVVIPTRNRSGLCAALIRSLRQCGLTGTILLADSSDTADAERNSESCRRATVIQLNYAPDVPFYDKVLDVLSRVPTPLV